MIEFHADDFGLFKNQSKRIIDCIDNGALNAVSIMPNSPHLEECMELLDKDVLLTVHLNIIEGKRLSEAKKEYITKNGIFCTGFGKLLLSSYIPIVNKKFKEDIKKEIKLQIERCKPYFNEKPIRLDSHCHYHMLPVMFDAMIEAIEEENIDISYIRMPREDLNIYKRLKGKTEKIKPINILKVFILNYLYGRNTRKYGDILNKYERKQFFGVAFSGEMKEENALPIVSYIEKNNIEAEVLFHPGAVFEKEDKESLTLIDDIVFLASENRIKEANSLKKIKYDLIKNN